MARRLFRAVAWTSGAIVLALLGVLAVVVLRYVPFDLPSYGAWTAIGVAVASVLCVIRPPRLLGRRRAAFACLAATTLAVVAVLWPAPVVRATSAHKRLDDFLPEYQFHEYHELVVEAPAERVADAARQVSFADMAPATWLLRVRHLAGGDLRALRPQRADARPILDLLARPGSGFLPLDTTRPTEIVYGMAGKPWTNEPPPGVSTPEEFLAFAAPGQIRVAFDIRVEDLGDGRTRVSTETRTLGNDEEARRVFARYWHLIYPGSAIIRGMWLEAIAARALLADAADARAS